jgi:adhesin transport system membrane fusion protein
MQPDKPEKLSTHDFDFVENASSAVLQDTPQGGRLILWGTIVFLMLGLLWSSLAELDEVTRGSGKIITTSQLQVIQNFEGGILSEILVKEGDVVEPGQILVKIDDTFSGSSFRESRLHYLGLKARASRLRAEAEDLPCDPPLDVMKELPSLVDQEFKLLQARQKELNANLAVIKQQIEQRKHELEELKIKNRQASKNYQLGLREFQISEPLLQSGAISDMEMLRLEQKINDYKGDMDSTFSSMDRSEHSYQESIAKAQEIELAFRNQARTELGQVSQELSRLEEMNVALEDRVKRTQVRAPMKGTVKQIMVTTIGEIIHPGVNIMEVVPFEDTLLVEAHIRPADIAFLYPGQRSVVKLSAYDYAVYGGLDGFVEHISADTIIDIRGDSYYRVRIRTDRTHLGSDEKPLPIIPGMTAQVDIITGKKTVLKYLLHPILRAKENALRER